MDTASPVPLPVPDLLRASSEPGAYLVQAQGPLTPAFRARIAAQGGRVVSYIPNNAYLVRISAAGAAALRAGTLAVLPFEPYFKLDPGLLARALELEPLPEHALVRVTAYAEDRDTVLADLTALGAGIVAEGRGTVGFEPEPQFVVAPRATSLAALAALPGVQLIETYADRVLLNDLTRERLGVAADTVTATNYLGLTGSNVWVNINDSGVWAEHPDLKGRVFAGDTNNLLEDPLGHGTHVAGIIASTGANGPTGTNVPPGSLTNATFRGFATNASLLVLGVDRTLGPLSSDLVLREVAAATNYLTLQRTNALISNNSWGYARVFEYDSAAASYDAAVRDALPGQPGSQPLLYVFAAGNEAYGNDDGSGGNPGSILSPATAKNVITVGATENLRPITYEVVATNQVTNIFEGEFFVTNVVETNTITIRFSDSDDEVAPFSGRGNVGLGIEGDNGRFKPDIVAPGVFIVSTAPTNWTVDLMLTNSTILAFPDQLVLPTEWNQYGLLVPARTARLTIRTLPAPNSPDPFPDLEIYARFGDRPTTADLRGVGEATIDSPEEGPWYYSIANPTQAPVSFNLVVRLDLTVDASDYLDLLRDINEPLAPYYRYDNGTSASAAAVSGLLALMQEFFEQQLERPYSPALMKALLINGARSLSSRYNLEVRPQINYQGWGLPALTNIFPAALTNLIDRPDQWPVRWVDQHPTNALATAQTHQYDLTIPTNALTSDLRVTLVWTDPPGNPAASIRLVNDLDLVVSNRTTGLWYLGNDIPASSDYNRPVSTNDNVGLADNINNVENVFLRGPIDTNYTVYVTARRVNVNAVTAHTNAIAQDYALVVSVSGTNALTFTPQPLVVGPPVEATILTNGVPVIHQRAGAHSPLIGTRDGTTNQWQFYVFTNEFNPDLTDGDTNFGRYVAFAVFMPPNLSVPRVGGEGDIDMYVLRGNSNLVHLDPAALNASITSLQRGGTETVTFEDGEIGEVFYVGIKAEDQMSAEYNLIASSSDEPFGQLLDDGSYMISGRPRPRRIPDGTPQSPGASFMFGFGTYPMVVGRALAYTTVRHEEMGTCSAISATPGASPFLTTTALPPPPPTAPSASSSMTPGRPSNPPPSAATAPAASSISSVPRAVASGSSP
ncbi:MAG: S8 family serine peptidase [Verrucomicrobia bacterium]|nr:S8 family serine peptidase [Verrucomicrobiota bacterium]